MIQRMGEGDAAALEAAEGRIRKCLARIDENTATICYELGAIEERELWRVRRKYSSFEDWADGELDIKRSQLDLFVRVRESFSREQLANQGASKLGAVLAYSKAMRRFEGKSIDFEKDSIEVAGPRGQRIVKPLLEASRREVVAATTAVRMKHGKKAPAPDKTKKKEQLESNLRQALDDANLRDVAVDAQWKERKQDYVFSFSGIEMERIFAALTVLRKHCHEGGE